MRFLYAGLFILFLAPAQAAEPIPCKCRAPGGVSISAGTCTCLDGRLACCGKVLNNTAWRFTAMACPMAQLDNELAAANAPTSAGPGAAVTAGGRTRF